MLADGQTGYRKRRYLPFDVEPDRKAALRGSGFSNETNCGQSEDRRKHTSGFFSTFLERSSLSRALTRPFDKGVMFS